MRSLCSRSGSHRPAGKSTLLEVVACVRASRRAIGARWPPRTCTGGSRWIAGARGTGDRQNLAAAEAAGLLRIGQRLAFEHPLVRSAAHGGAGAEELRRVHAALAEATDEHRDPDRRAWHRALATFGLSESVAAALEQSAGRAGARRLHGSGRVLRTRHARGGIPGDQIALRRRRSDGPGACRSSAEGAPHAAGGPPGRGRSGRSSAH